MTYFLTSNSNNCLFASLVFLTFHNIKQSEALLKSMQVQSPWVSPQLRHPALLTPAHQWLVIPHSCPTGKDLRASFLLMLPPSFCHFSTMPRALLGAALFWASFTSSSCTPFILLGKEIAGIPKAGVYEEVFLCPFAPSLSPLAPSMEVTSLWAAPVQLLVDRKERKKAGKFPGF